MLLRLGDSLHAYPVSRHIALGQLHRLLCVLYLLPPILMLGQTPGEPVLLEDVEIFRVYGRLGSFSPTERASAISQRIKTLAVDPTISENSISVVDSEVSSDIVTGDKILFSAVDADARLAGQSRQELARSYAEKIRFAVVDYRRAHSREHLTRGVAVSAGATVALLIACWLAVAVIRRTGARLRTSMKDSGIAQFTLKAFGAERASRMRRAAARVTFFIVLGGVLHGYLLIVSAQFPGTRRLEQILFDSLTRPVMALFGQFVAQIPNLIFVLVTLALALGFNRALRVLFESIESEQIHVGGFYPDWAEPTYKLLALLVVVAALVIAFPYIPGSNSPAFQGVSLLFGVLFSIGSTSLVGNAFAGVVLIYMRSFRVGDRVKIADTMGDVEEKNLLVTRVKTVKNEYITISNSLILGSHVINYSKAAADDGLILYTSVTIGYDAPWRLVHELLIRAGLRTQGVSPTPAPFVLQTALCDSYVEYQINVFTQFPRKMSSIYSELRQNIQDSFNEAGVEIMSPAYHAVRAGNQQTTPKSYLAAEYEAPSFRVISQDSSIRRRSAGQSRT